MSKPGDKRAKAAFKRLLKGCAKGKPMLFQFALRDILADVRHMCDELG
jgi:hypothetical protein